jgi:hypothetical protein
MKERGKLLRRSYSEDPRGEVKSMLKKGANTTMLAPLWFPKNHFDFKSISYAYQQQQTPPQQRS